MPKANRQAGIHLHKTIAPNYYTGKHEYYWILIARNGKTIARSSETYCSKRATIKSIRIAAEIITGHNPIEYYDHTRKDAGNWVEF